MRGDPGSGNPEAITLQLARIAARLLDGVSPDPLAALALLRIQAAPG